MVVITRPVAGMQAANEAPNAAKTTFWGRKGPQTLLRDVTSGGAPGSSGSSWPKFSVLPSAARWSQKRTHGSSQFRLWQPGAPTHFLAFPGAPHIPGFPYLAEALWAHHSTWGLWPFGDLVLDKLYSPVVQGRKAAASSAKITVQNRQNSQAVLMRQLPQYPITSSSKTTLDSQPASPPSFALQNQPPPLMVQFAVTATSGNGQGMTVKPAKSRSCVICKSLGKDGSQCKGKGGRFGEGTRWGGKATTQLTKERPVHQNNAIEALLKPHHHIVLLDPMRKANAHLLLPPPHEQCTQVAHNNIEVHAKDTDAGVIVRTQIDVLLDAAAELACFREVAVADADGRVHGNFLVASDAGCADGVVHL
ncbi:hypothetical protein C8J57DRAFT_1247527 [Mycena rebaudengoi]|nr:hypothetical protein C8J57DRAFT_1247527 [Mycena rebaudengoi]